MRKLTNFEFYLEVKNKDLLNISAPEALIFGEIDGIEFRWYIYDDIKLDGLIDIIYSNTQHPAWEVLYEEYLEGWLLSEDMKSCVIIKSNIELEGINHEE